MVGVVELSYFQNFPVPQWGESVTAILALGFLMIGGYLVGDRVARWINLFDGPPSPQPDHGLWIHLIRLGLGWGVISLAVLLLGTLVPGGLKQNLFLLVMALVSGLLVAARRFPARLRNLKSLHPPKNPGLLELCILIPGLVGMGVSLITCFSPITYYDSLVYHLGLPAFYSAADQIHAVPFNLYSSFPAQTEMLFLFILNQLPQPEYVINLFCWILALGTSLGLYAWAREEGDRRQGLLCAGLWWTTPAVLFLSSGAYVELALAFYILLSVRTLLRAQEQHWDRRWIFVSGLFSGMAAATKYTGATSALLLGMFLTFQFLFRKGPSVWKLLLFGLAVFLPFGPWLIKNAVSIGNPFFPFFFNVFGGHVGWTHQTASGYFNMLTEYGSKSNLLYDLFLAPFTIATSSLKYGGGFDVLGDFGWPLFIFGFPLALFLAKSKKIRFLFLFVLAYSAVWFLTKPVLRFLLGILPLFVVLTASALNSLLERNGKLSKIALALLVLPWLVSNFFMTFFIFAQIQPFHVPLGLETREQFLTRRLSYYATYQYANDHLTSTDKIFLLGEQRGYHLKVPYVSANLFAPSPMSAWLNDAPSLESVANHFRGWGVNHLIVNKPELDRLGGPRKLGLSKSGWSLLNRFLRKNGQVLYSKNGVFLSRLHHSGQLKDLN